MLVIPLPEKVVQFGVVGLAVRPEPMKEAYRATLGPGILEVRRYVSDPKGRNRVRKLTLLLVSVNGELSAQLLFDGPPARCSGWCWTIRPSAAGSTLTERSCVPAGRSILPGHKRTARRAGQA